MIPIEHITDKDYRVGNFAPTKPHWADSWDLSTYRQWQRDINMKMSRILDQMATKHVSYEEMNKLYPPE